MENLAFLEASENISSPPVAYLLRSSLPDSFLQQKELTEEFDKISGQPRATRLLRSQQQRDPVAAAVVEEVEVGEAVSAAPVVIDAYDLCEPVDVLGALAKTNFWEGIVGAIRPWNEANAQGRRGVCLNSSSLDAQCDAAAGDIGSNGWGMAVK